MWKELANEKLGLMIKLDWRASSAASHLMGTVGLADLYRVREDVGTPVSQHCEGLRKAGTCSIVYVRGFKSRGEIPFRLYK